MKRNVSLVRLIVATWSSGPLFKFRCNILISANIIKEMPGLVASGTPYYFSLTGYKIYTSAFCSETCQRTNNWCVGGMQCSSVCSFTCCISETVEHTTTKFDTGCFAL